MHTSITNSFIYSMFAECLMLSTDSRKRKIAHFLTSYLSQLHIICRLSVYLPLCLCIYIFIIYLSLYLYLSIYTQSYMPSVIFTDATVEIFGKQWDPPHSQYNNQTLGLNTPGWEYFLKVKVKERNFPRWAEPVSFVISALSKSRCSDLLYALLHKKLGYQLH